jgi:glycosyltransferase involved in cell wall biosynthesis
VKVLALQADKAGCGNARIEVPYTALRSLGHHVDICDQVREDQLSLYDVIVLQRPGNKWSIPIAEWCRRSNVPLVCELDDLCWALPDWNPFKEAWEVPIEGTKTSWEVQQDTLRLATAVTVTNEALAAEIRPFCPNVYILPNFIDITLFEDPGHNRTPVTIGWFGSHTHQRDLDWMSGVVGRVMRKHPETMLMTIGGYAPADAALGHGVPPERHRKIGWVDDRRVLNTGLAFMDIGLAPLTPDKFNESKSWIKVLEYGAVGVPTVASDVGPYSHFLREHPDIGYLCKTKGEFLAALDDLLSHPEKRLAMGKRAREVAEQNSIQNNVYRWEVVLKEIVSQVRQPVTEPT